MKPNGKTPRRMVICNVVGSTIAREAGDENTLFTYAGPEIAVASTKAYSTQVETLLMIATRALRICATHYWAKKKSKP